MCLRELKEEYHDLKIIVVEDGRFYSVKEKRSTKAPFYIVLIRAFRIEKVIIDDISVDGLDSTNILIKNLKKLDFDMILLSGISFGGFNIIDAQRVFTEFKKPVIIVTDTKPRNNLIKKTLKLHFSDWSRRYSLLKNLGSIYCCKTVYNNPIYFEVIGLNFKKAKRVLKDLTFIGKLPEPIRIVKIIAKELS